MGFLWPLCSLLITMNEETGFIDRHSGQVDLINKACICPINTGHTRCIHTFGSMKEVSRKQSYIIVRDVKRASWIFSRAMQEMTGAYRTFTAWQVSAWDQFKVPTRPTHSSHVFPHSLWSYTMELHTLAQYLPLHEYSLVTNATYDHVLTVQSPST